MGKLEGSEEPASSGASAGHVTGTAPAGARASRASRGRLRAEMEAYWRGRTALADGMRDTAPLRAAVREFVTDLRHAGVPPERMLVLIKEVVLQVTETQGPEAHTLIDLVVGWSIEWYFAPPPS